jgi:diaminopimelate decarboxylase
VRVTPGIEADTHEAVKTAHHGSKFGLPPDDALAALRVAPHAEGLHVPVGSQLLHLGAALMTVDWLGTFAARARAETGWTPRTVDLGGGLGVRYRGADNLLPHPDEYAAVVKAAVGDLGLKLIFEPGRIIAGNAGVLVTRVLYRKRSIDKTFTIIDAAMNDLIRPTLYDAYHEVWPVWQARSESPAIVQDLVGPVCETGDYFALNRSLPLLESGDLLAVMTAGAYGAVMSSTYNTRRLVPEVLVRGTEYAVVRPRPSYEELIGLDRLPDWLRDD